MVTVRMRLKKLDWRVVVKEWGVWLEERRLRQLRSQAMTMPPEAPLEARNEEEAWVAGRKEQALKQSMV